jgi:hypothetical protein
MSAAALYKKVKTLQDKGEPRHASAELVKLFASDEEAAHRALKFLFTQQTDDEQTAETTFHKNGRGFDARTARRGSVLAKKARGGFAPSGPHWGLRPQTPALAFTQLSI